MYERLLEALTELGETDLEIDSAFIFKVGCARLLASKDSISSNTNSDQEEQPNPYTNSHRKIIEALQRHPNVFDVAVGDDDKAFGFAIPKSKGTLIGGASFSLRVNLPARLQKYGDWEYLSGKKPIEEFEVISSGCLFAAFAKIQDYPIWTHIGHEYREILQTQIEKETGFESPSLGPSPIHPSFYLVFRARRDGIPSPGMRVYAVEDDVLLVFDKEIQTEQDVAVAVFHDIESPMLDFYSTQITRSALLECYEKITLRFSELSGSARGLSTTPWWRVFKSSKLARTGRRCLSSIHERIVEYETLLFFFNRERNQLLTEIDHHPMLSYTYDYFNRHTETGCEIPQALSSALRYFEGELQTFGNIRSVVIATLLGAAIGAVLTALLPSI